MASIEDILKEANGREKRTLPPVSQLTDIRVWQDGTTWYAETGTAPDNVAVDGAPFTSEAEAVAHGITAIYDARNTLALNLELDLRRDLKGAPEPTVHYGRA